MTSERGSLQTSTTTYSPADPRATKQVRMLLSYLREQSGKTMLSGQTDLPDLEWVTKNTGKTPAILGLDFMRYTSQMGKQVGDTEKALQWWKKQHGIVTFQWHWVSPTGARNKEAGFNTRDTDFDLAAALANPDSAEYKGLISDIDDVAAEIKKLATARVPILFRPLHEAQGRWFWWGAKGAGPCLALYRLIFERMTKRHGLHNIVWVWTAYPTHAGKGNAEEWYPGDAFVDIIASDYMESTQDFTALVDLTRGKKMVALAETMNAPEPKKALASGIQWVYWVCWARRDWHKNSEADVKVAMNSPETITLDKLPDVSRW